jgi:hypothetical protein
MNFTFSEPARPAIDAMLMMRPLLFGIIHALATPCANRNRLRTLRSITLSQASSGCVSAGAPQVAPALLIRMSMRPMRRIVSSTTFWICAGSLASAATQRVSMPRDCRCAEASSRSPALREVSSTFAPASPSASAICSPRPREPPVTSAVLPLRSKSC